MKKDEEVESKRRLIYVNPHRQRNMEECLLGSCELMPQATAGGHIKCLTLRF
jgi:hypothetical protein